MCEFFKLEGSRKEKEFTISWTPPKSRHASSSTPTTKQCLPHVLLAGMPKCGTSTLFGLLSFHPQVELVIKIDTVRLEIRLG